MTPSPWMAGNVIKRMKGVMPMALSVHQYTPESEFCFPIQVYILLALIKLTLAFPIV